MALEYLFLSDAFLFTNFYWLQNSHITFEILCLAFKVIRNFSQPIPSTFLKPFSQNTPFDLVKLVLLDPHATLESISTLDIVPNICNWLSSTDLNANLRKDFLWNTHSTTCF